jgi:anti-sigma B factor antagonist
VVEDVFPVRWSGGQVVVALPEHIGIANAGQIRDQLLSVINRGAVALIADMTATVSCDHAGADAVFRAFQRASASETELRLVVTARLVSRVLAFTGLNRLVSIYPSLEAAEAASAAPPADPAPAADPAPTVAAIAAAKAIGRVPPVRDDPALAGATAAAERAHRDLLDAVVTSNYRAGLILQTSLDLPADAAGQRVTAVLGDLDDIIHGIRGSVDAARGRAALRPPYLLPSALRAAHWGFARRPGAGRPLSRGGAGSLRVTVPSTKD